MIHDATVEVTCDRLGCTESLHVEPEYVYVNRSGGGGHYDTSDRAIHKLIGGEGWTVRGDQTYCETHSEEPQQALQG